MRIAVVHSFYSSASPSGENDVAVAQAAQLRALGHDVLLVARSSDDVADGLRDKVRLARDVAFGTGASPLDQITAFRPDIVHAHNLFPNWSRRSARHWPGRVVATLHNFRYACAAATFYRDGHECTDCVGRAAVPGLVHACYRDSRAATLPLTVATARGAAGNELLTRADAVVCLSDRARQLHVRAGVPQAKLALVPNFVAEDPAPSPGSRSGWLYLGRLTDEKGVLQLVRSWPPGETLSVYGAGPLRDELAAQAGAGVELRGLVPADEVPALLRSARGLVFPSRWAESAVPVVYLQALAAGTPTIALRGNGAADDVLAHGTGVVVDDWRGLAAAIASVELDWPRYAAAALDTFERRYSRQAWSTAMTELYERVLSEPAQQHETGDQTAE